MLQGANIFEFFLTKEERRWNRADVKEFLASFPEKKFPCFAIAIETIYTTANVVLKNAIDESTIETVAATVTAGTIKVISYIGKTVSGTMPDGYYYLDIQLNAGAFHIYSDVFNVGGDLSKLIKFSILSSDIVVNASITLPYGSLNPVFYLPYNSATMIDEIKEEGIEKSFGDMPISCTVNILNKVEINGTAHIFKMLAFMRALLVNGELAITLRGSTSNVYNILAEIKDDQSEGDSVIITFTYREYNFISSKNAI